jgi:hypothetical protein
MNVPTSHTVVPRRIILWHIHALGDNCEANIDGRYLVTAGQTSMFPLQQLHIIMGSSGFYAFRAEI